MNIRLIHTVIRQHAAGALAIATAAAVTVLSGSAASAQPGLVNSMTPGQASLASGPTAAGASFGLPPGTQIISASSVRTAADISPRAMAPGAISQAMGTVVGDVSQANAGRVAQVGFACNSCNQSSCNGGCNSYGGYGGGAYASNTCGVPCNPYHYVIVEGLFMQRGGDSDFNLSQNVPMDDFDFEWAPRITIGSLPNCVNGYEFTWVGPLEFDRSVLAVDGTGNLNTLLYDGDGNTPNGFDGSVLDPFSNANVQYQAYTSEYWSGELNKTLVGWDVAKVLIGGRYISIEEDYLLASQQTAGNTSASLRSQTENALVGIQGGLDLLYPIAQHVYTDFRGRAGAYANFAESNVDLRNQGSSVIRRNRDDTELAGVFEIGGGIRYQMGEMLSIRAGGEMWYITNVATAPDQINTAVTNNLGRNIDIDQGLFYYGVNIGAELRF
ncbi:hypothetical protein NHH03_19675 [Stieleria sp. TO1_6]|uniref:hypothetical protein n=1 Tax=Stieleria tagensis TaxID=2956795 RepID=UPI00209B891C|nr:hypothetical protein [Stieleria tagensis]MCO8123974.1 hypothetical protein [Stieleria tagensis]